MRRAALMALTVALVGGCGGGNGGARDDVAAYMNEVSAIQKRYAKPIAAGNEAYQAFARGGLEPDVAETRLAAAEQAIRSAGAPLTDLEPPTAARALHSKLLRLFDLNAAFAREATVLAHYGPASEAALAPLDRANRSLRSGLGSARSAASQVRVLRRFTGRVNRVTLALKAVEAPTVLLPPHGDQIRNLRATERAAGRLAGALRRKDARRVAREVKRFRRTLTARRPRRGLADQAIDQYNRRYRQLLEAQADVRREEGRLDRTLT